jgi:hypothetical protein
MLFAENDKLKQGMCEELRHFSREFYATGTQHLTQSWKKCDDNEADFVEKNLNFVKIVAMIYANLIISVITVYD